MCDIQQHAIINYEWARGHLDATGTIDFIPNKSEITVDYPVGGSRKVTLHDGSELYLQKNAEDCDLTSRKDAMNRIETVKTQQKILTGGGVITTKLSLEYPW